MGRRKLIHGSTFSGIGGPEVAATILGWENAFHCEINPFGRKVLEYYYPDSKSYEDITKTDFSEWRGRIDVLTGGFPCQPFSYAGKRRGAEDDRYLWPYMLRCIEQVRPAWFIGENVAGIATMALPGETVKVGSETTLFGETDYLERREKLVIEDICRQLESVGYSVQPVLVPACAVGAPHRRDRIFFIARRDDAAYPTNKRLSRSNDTGSECCIPKEMGREVRDSPECHISTSPDGSRLHSPHPDRRGGGEIHEHLQSEFTDGAEPFRDGGEYDAADTEGKRIGCDNERESGRTEQGELGGMCCKELLPENRWRTFPTVSPVCGRYDGFSSGVVRYLNNDAYDAIKEFIGIENLPNVRQELLQEKVWEAIGRLYKIPIKDILFEILFSAEEKGRSYERQNNLSIRSKEVSERVLRNLRKQRQAPCSSQRRKLEEQLSGELGHTMLPLSFEIALAALEIGKEIQRMRSYVRTESLKAYGNAIVPQVMYEIFSAIDRIENENL